MSNVGVIVRIAVIALANIRPICTNKEYSVFVDDVVVTIVVVAIIVDVIRTVSLFPTFILLRKKKNKYKQK